MFSFDSTVRFSECDESSTLTLVSLINYLQDCSAFHTESLDVGIEFQRRRGYAWAITSWRIEIERLPHLCDPIKVSTFCYSIKGTHAMRNYAIFDESGERLVAADAKYVVFDRATGKIMRIPESESVYLEDTPRLEMGALEKKILLPGDYDACEPIVISKHHLDYNDHVNNAQYVQMAVEAASAIRDLGTPHALDVQYRKMAFLGDTVVPHVRFEEPYACIDLTDDDGASYAIVRIEYAGRS